MASDEDTNLARWQGRTEAQLNDNTRRLDTINGDVRDIKHMVAQMRQEVFEREIIQVAARKKDRIALIAAIAPMGAATLGAIVLLLTGGGGG